MECNTTIQYLCDDKERQAYIDQIISTLFDSEIDLSARKSAFEAELGKTDKCADMSLDSFPNIANNYSFGSVLEKRKTGFSAFYFLLGWDADEFCSEMKLLLKSLGAKRVNCRKEWV